MKRFFGDIAFYKKVAAIAIPIILQQLLIASVALVDNVMVGQLGEPSINGVTIVNQLNFVIMIVTFGVMGGAGIFTAQYFGAKQTEQLKMSFRYKINAALVVSTIGVFLFIVFGETMIGWFTREDLTQSLGLTYLNIVTIGLFPFIMSLAISSTFRETGIAKPLLFISLFALILNAAINYVLIFGYLGFPKLGVAGAAIGTVIARYIEMTLLIVLMFIKKSPFKFKLQTLFSIPRDMIQKINKKALPLTVNEIFWSIGQTVVIFAFALRGETELAAMNVANGVSQIVFVIFGGIATSVAVMVGNTLGENKLKEAEENAYKLIMTAFMLAVIVGLILLAIAPIVIDFYDIEPQTRIWALKATRYNSVLIWLYSVNVAMYFTLRSGGDVKSTIYADSGFSWAIMVPIALILGYFTSMDIALMFLIVKGTELPKVFFAWYLIKKKRWLQNLTVDIIV
jgi:putative MATE family efflux protein